MVILCLSNAVFLLKHLLDFEIDVHDMGNVMLTIIGFLFAFAAINIYSIFNTNVDEEKGRIVQLTQEYELLFFASDQLVKSSEAKTIANKTIQARTRL